MLRCEYTTDQFGSLKAICKKVIQNNVQKLNGSFYESKNVKQNRIRYEMWGD